MNKLTHIKSSN